MRIIYVLPLILLSGCGDNDVQPTATATKHITIEDPIAGKSKMPNETTWPALLVSDVTRVNPETLCDELMRNGCEASRDAFFEEYESLLRAETDRRFDVALRVRENVMTAIRAVFDMKRRAFGSGNHEGTRLSAYVEHEIFVGLLNHFKLYDEKSPTTIDHRYTICDIKRLINTLVEAGFKDGSWLSLECWAYRFEMEGHKKRCIDSLKLAECEMTEACKNYFRYLVWRHLLNSFP